MNMCSKLIIRHKFLCFLLRNQLKAFGRIASLDYHNCVRDLIFEPADAFTLKAFSFQRSKGDADYLGQAKSSKSHCK